MDDNIVDKLKSILNNNNASEELQNILSNINSGTNTEKQNNNNSNTDSTISPDAIENILKMFREKQNSETNSEENNIDFETIMKFKNIMDKMNSKDDPRAKLLISLKPYLKETRKNKIDQYIQFLKISKVFNIFSNNGEKIERKDLK